MDCDDAILRIYQYLDGELTVWRRRAITRHLDDCPPCAQGFDFEIELRAVIASKCPTRSRRISAGASPRPSHCRRIPASDRALTEPFLPLRPGTAVAFYSGRRSQAHEEVR